MQAYLDNIKAKTGLTPADFKRLATEKNLVKHSEIIAWLKTEYELGHGHANAIAATLKDSKPSGDQKLEAIFKNKTSSYRLFETLLEQIKVFAPDTTLAPTSSYISLLKNGKKFGIVQPSAESLDIGIKLKTSEPTVRLKPAATWNSMVTHRVQVSHFEEIDTELLAWLKMAYQTA